MSFAAQTWTMDSTTTTWVLPDGTSLYLTDNAQTVSFTATDTGDGGIYFGAAGSSFTLNDGSIIEVEGNQDITNFASEANGATVRNGSIWVRHNGGPRHEVVITTMNVTNGDAVGANNLASITFEYPGKPWQWTWTNVNTA